jgi:hypothetical protein
MEIEMMNLSQIESDDIQRTATRSRFVVFRNRGLIDVRAITTFGVSAKDPCNSNPIGYFGTGLKYAIAVLLRNDIPITIHSGLDTYAFEARRDVIRSKTFDMVYMNDSPIGFTTDLGKTESYGRHSGNSIPTALTNSARRSRRQTHRNRWRA